MSRFLAAQLGALVCAWMLLVHPSLAHANDYVVNVASDLPDASPGDRACATASGSCTLRAALQEIAADSTVELHRITFSSSAATSANVVINGELVVPANRQVSITGPVGEIVTVTALNTSRVFHVAAGAEVTLQRLLVTLGSESETDCRGGGILNEGDLTLIEVELSNNRCSGSGARGGAIANLTTGTLEVQSSTFGLNSTAVAGGPLLYNEGVAWVRDSQAVQNDQGLIGFAFYNSGSLGLERVYASGYGGVISFGGVVAMSNVMWTGVVGVTAEQGAEIYMSNCTVRDTGLSGDLATDAIVRLRNSVIGNCSGNALEVNSYGYNYARFGCSTFGSMDTSGGGALDWVEGEFGGGIPSIAPLEGSPVIDSGDPGGCDAWRLTSANTVSESALTQDARTAPRPVDGDGDGGSRCDIGAYEFDDGLVVTGDGGQTTEAGGTATVTVALRSAPVGAVVVDVSLGGTDEASASVAMLSFDPDNWDSPQPIVLTGQDDADVDGEVGYTLTLTVNAGATADARYDAIVPVAVGLTNADDDVAVTDAGVAMDQGTGNGADSGVITDAGTGNDPDFGITVDAGTSPDAGGSGVDAGAAPPMGGGGGCSATPATRASTLGFMLVLLGLLVARRRRSAPDQGDVPGC